MEATPNGILTMDQPVADLHLSPAMEAERAALPGNLAKKMRRQRALPATVGYVEDRLDELARAMLMNFGPLATLQAELMQRQAAVEDHLGFVYRGDVPRETAQATDGSESGDIE